MSFFRKVLFTFVKVFNVISIGTLFWFVVHMFHAWVDLNGYIFEMVVLGMFAVSFLVALIYCLLTYEEKEK